MEMGLIDLKSIRYRLQSVRMNGVEGLRNATEA